MIFSKHIFVLTAAAALFAVKLIFTADRPVRTEITKIFPLRSIRVKEQFILKIDTFRRRAPFTAEIAPFEIIYPAVPRTVFAHAPTFGKNLHQRMISPLKRQTERCHFVPLRH